MKAFKNVRHAELARDYCVVKAAVNLEEIFRKVKVPIVKFNILRIVHIVHKYAGLRLLARLQARYPAYSTITTDERMAKYVGGSRGYSSFKTKYIAGRWCYDFKDFDMYLATGDRLQIDDIGTAVGGASVRESQPFSLPNALHIDHLVLSKKPLEEDMTKVLSEKKDAHSFEKAILEREAILIFPEYDEGLMPPDYRPDPIFSDHHYEVPFEGAPNQIRDVYIISTDHEALEIVKEIELP